jgi:hypothetical protein
MVLKGRDMSDECRLLLKSPAHVVEPFVEQAKQQYQYPDYRNAADTRKTSLPARSQENLLSVFFSLRVMLTLN